MSISPGLTYLSIYFNGPNNERWIVEDLPGDLLAGFILGLFTFLNEIETINEEYMRGLFIEIQDPNKTIVAFNVYDIRILLNPNYNTGKQFWGTEELKDLNVMGLLDNHFGWLIYNVDDYYYRLYRFESPQFIQGFITICKAFQVDFRDYIAGPPFRYEAGVPTYYQIEGYDIPLLPINEDEYKDDTEY